MPSATLSAEDEANVQQILRTARAGDLPQGWFVWPLRRDRVARAALGWAAAGLFGTALLVLAALDTVPSNFQTGAGLAAFTIVLLFVLGAVAVGGLVLGVRDSMRWARAAEYLLVMTPDDYVQVSPSRIVHVPMTSVAYVTLRGVKTGPPDDVVERTGPRSNLRWAAMIGGGATMRREMRSAPSLAFVDLRDGRTVVVASDNAFDDLPVLEEILALHARGRGMPPPRARSRR